MCALCVMFTLNRFLLSFFLTHTDTRRIERRSRSREPRVFVRIHDASRAQLRTRGVRSTQTRRLEKMKQMRDEILRLKIALSHVTNDAKMTTTTTEKEEKDAVEQHFLAPAGASISSSSPPASSHVRLNQDDISIPLVSRRRVCGY